MAIIRPKEAETCPVLLGNHNQFQWLHLPSQQNVILGSVYCTIRITGNFWAVLDPLSSNAPNAWVTGVANLPHFLTFICNAYANRKHFYSSGNRTLIARAQGKSANLSAMEEEPRHLIISWFMPLVFRCAPSGEIAFTTCKDLCSLL